MPQNGKRPQHLQQPSQKHGPSSTMHPGLWIFGRSCQDGHDQCHVQNGWRCRSGCESAPNLQHRPQQRHQTNHWCIRQHDLQQLHRQDRVFALRLQRKQHHFKQCDDNREKTDPRRDPSGRKSSRRRTVLLVSLGVHRKKGRGQRAFSKQTTEEVGNLKGQKENVCRAPHPERSSEYSIAQQACAPGSQSQDDTTRLEPPRLLTQESFGCSRRKS